MHGFRAFVASLLLLAPASARAFCGFYVAGADSKLFNQASQVALMRHGTQTVLSMQNHYQGPPADFAMVVPVPVILKKENVKTLSREVFDDLDKLTAPRLVEYWEADPCRQAGGPYGTIGHGSGTGSGYGVGGGRGGMGGGGVRIEARFSVGEYDIVILSAIDSTGLETWLKTNGYKIPAGAEPFLRPYVQAGMKFFVAKVDVNKVRMEHGSAQLSPLRVAYDSTFFTLPIRLGLINSNGVQDLIVYLIGETRFEAANRKNVTIPTNLRLKETARARFGELYVALFDAVLGKTPGAAVTEYAWPAESCDPCPGLMPGGLPLDDLATLGGDVIPMQMTMGRVASVSTIRIGTATVTGKLDPAIVRRYLRRQLPRLQYCYEKQVTTNPGLAGTVTVEATIDEQGKVADVKASGVDPQVSSCVAETVRSIEFPKPPKGKVQITYPFIFTPPFSPPAHAKGEPMKQVVITRLHFRYGKDVPAADLVFRAAPALVGGTGIPDEKGKMLATAPGSASNSFQGRYVILHPWKGKLACKQPVHGVWGGPPGRGAEPGPEPARDLAFVKRGAVQLRDLVVEGLPPDLTP